MQIIDILRDYVNLARPVVMQLAEFGETRRGWLGVGIQDVTAEMAASLGRPNNYGAMVVDITKTGPADGVVLQGDIILDFNGKQIVKMRDLPRFVAETAVGQSVKVLVLREGKEVTLDITLGRLEEGEQILQWLVMPDGDLLCPQGIDWAERDVQHSWAFSELGTLLDQRWARAAETRCLGLLTRRQAVFGDGSIHALDFGYETDLATVWTYSFLLHKYFGKADAGPNFDEPRRIGKHSDR